MPEYPCTACGARVEYAPGGDVLRCPYCGHEQPVAAAVRQVREHAFTELAQLPRKPLASLAAQVFVCRKCGAQTQSQALSQACQFCGAPLVADASLGGQIAPEAVLPFEVDRAGVRAALRAWVASRWFAPSQLKKVTEAESLKGTYLPHWTFDAGTESDYRGERGEHYYVTETYTETVNGQSQTRTRQVQKTRWYNANGTVRRGFDDILVPATGHLSDKQLDKLTPWPLERAAAYQPDYLAGYDTLRYDVEPESGLQTAKERMAPVITEDCRRDIGGDEQRVHSVDTRYFDVTYKLMLLPVWIVAYLYAGRPWQVLVNARTGEVIGERPYSAAKITAAVVAALLLVTAIIVLIVMARSG
jgi:DNA-directed RNA polymerase subunit RPC12/RpoP